MSELSEGKDFNKISEENSQWSSQTVTFAQFLFSCHYQKVNSIFFEKSLQICLSMAFRKYFSFQFYFDTYATILVQSLLQLVALEIQFLDNE